MPLQYAEGRRPEGSNVCQATPPRGSAPGRCFFRLRQRAADAGVVSRALSLWSCLVGFVSEVVVKIRALLLVTILGAVSSRAEAQAPSVIGTWEASIKDAKRTDAPRTVIVRPDSSASYGTETVRWRVTGAKTLLLALGGEWVSYDFKISGAKLTLSGGDLEKPITLTKLGPPTARPDSIPVPPDPDTAS